MTVTSLERLTPVRERKSRKKEELSPPLRLKETKGEAKRGAVSGRGAAKVNDTICHAAIKELRQYKKLISQVSLNLNDNTSCTT